jgi:flavin-dependent dehydrogenase
MPEEPPADCERCDVLVIGAGPAGTLAALECARRGASVLIVEKQAFPRTKVCGACVSHAAVGILAAHGLRDAVAALRPEPFNTLSLAVPGQRACLRIPEGWAVGRDALDACLAEAAVHAGAQLRTQTEATIGAPTRRDRLVHLTHAGAPTTVAARVVLLADGLTGRAARGIATLDPHIWPPSRVGGGATLVADTRDYAPGTIYMACTRDAYVGLVRLGTGQLNVALAADPAATRGAGGLGVLAARVLADAGLPRVCAIEDARWRGTPQLTRARRPLAAERVLALGDAAAYVEPFTGEGIAWALTAGAAVAPFAMRGIDRWDPNLIVEWTAMMERSLGPRRRHCALLTRCLRNAWAMRLAMLVLQRLPALARPYLRELSQRPAAGYPAAG